MTRGHTRIKSFLEEHGDIILKPLDGMGGASIFRVRVEDPNTNVIIETLTAHGWRFDAMAYLLHPRDHRRRQTHPPDRRSAGPLRPGPLPGAGGDPRESGGRRAQRGPWPSRNATARFCAEVGETLRRKGLVFAGLDVIGDYLTEINVTSPTCLRELDALYGLDIASQLMDVIEQRLR